MTITDVNLVSETGSDTKDRGRSYTEVFEVAFTSGYTTAAFLANSHADLPKRGWYLGQSAKSTSSDTSVYVTSVTPALKEPSQGTPVSGTTGIATYTVTYETPQLTIFDKAVPPLSRPAQIRWGGSEATEARQIDAAGNLIQNSAGDFYEDLPEFYLRGGEVSITLNVSGNPAATCVAYSFTTNGTNWYGVDRGNALFGKIEATKQFETFQGTDYTYWTITYPIAFRRDGWALHTFDYGYRAFDDNNNLKSYIDGNGVNVKTLLDGVGRPWDGDPIAWPDDSGFVIYEETGWGSLSIPNPFA